MQTTMQRTLAGIHKFNSSEYIVASASGVLQSIYIHTDSNALRISSKIHKATLNVSKYAVYGLVGSTNNAFLLAALYVRQVSYLCNNSTF